MILFYVIIKGSMTDEDEVQKKNSDGMSIFKILLFILTLDDVVNDVAETEDQEMGSGMSHKTDDEGTNIRCTFVTELNLFIIIYNSSTTDSCFKCSI